MIKQHVRIVFHLSKSFFLQEFRSRDSIFWILLFPVFMFILFGMLFGDTDIGDHTVIVGVDNALSRESEQINKFLLNSLDENEKVNTVYLEREEGFRHLAENRLYAFISGPGETGSLLVYVTEKNRPFQTVLNSLLQSSTLDSIQGMIKSHAPVIYEVRVLERNNRPLSYVYFLLSGIIGIAMMMNCFTAIPQLIISYRKQGFLKRFAFSPLRKSHFTVSVIIQRIIFGITQLLLLLAAAYLLFNVRLNISLFPFAFMFVTGTATFAVIGFFISGILRSVESAIAVAQILIILFLFTCGIFVPLEVLPPYLSWITNLNPAWHLSNAFYYTMVLGYGIGSTLQPLLRLVPIGFVFFLLTLVTFRYEKRL